jgi:hypothetical protein
MTLGGTSSAPGAGAQTREGNDLILSEYGMKIEDEEGSSPLRK